MSRAPASRIRPRRRTAAALVLLTSLALVSASPPALAADPAAGPAAATGPAATVEEQRLERAVPQEILRRSGFDEAGRDFARALRRAGSYREAERSAARHGARLWDRAVDRAQGRGPARGDLSHDDDRPLYWARLAMTRELRTWEPGFPLSASARARLLERLERSSRGQDSMDFPRGGGYRRIVMTGFDPFTLDRDIRISNPSGAAALALDGAWIRTAEGWARVETAVFPVRWRDFADGEVERTLSAQLPRADVFTTVSQGRAGRFDIERFNGAWRGGFPDNENLSSTGTVPVADPASQPQWTATTLPYKEIVAASTGRFPVYDNTAVTEIPAGGVAEVVRPDGPTPGSTARRGGGGDYLSNEIAYRATLLRDRLGLDIPGGHVHTPVLEFGDGNTTEVTDPDFVRNRLDIVAQVRAIITVAADGA
ncbi:pyroglutamyl peptidase [Streptomyces sp. MUM 178J]|uniref:pyroglutamyl peptidase n=1 Tax=Streptomyces sp. MUM 178J TaxID=2791991 RepID=UPI003FA7C212